MTVEWMGSTVLAAIRAGTVVGLQRGIEAVRDDGVSRILNPPKTGRVYRRNGVSHQASAPGESPANDTGNLARQMSTNVDPASLTATLSFSAPYARYLEYGTARISPRPWARPAVMAKRDEIQADIASEIGKALG